MFRSIRSLSLALSTALLLPLAACGGGGGGGDDVILQASDLIYPSKAHTILWSAGVPALSPMTALQIGDHGGNGAMRALVQFKLPNLPEGAVVTYAYMTVHSVKAAGSPSMLGAMKADHVDWPLATPLVPSYGTGHGIGTADIGQFQSPQFVLLNEPFHQWLDVTAQVAQDVALDRDTSAFRVYLNLLTDNDSLLDALWLDGVYPATNKAYDVELRITYEFPQP